MPLRIQPAAVTEAHALTLLFFAAFHPEDPFEHLIYPHGATPKAIAHEYDGIVKNFQDPHVHYMKVVDTEIPPDGDGSEIIAWARWKIWRKERPQHIWDLSWQPSKPDLSKATNGVVDDVDVVVEQSYFENLQEMRRKYIGGMPCVYMSMLCTRPTQQRRGAAKLLLRWGLDFADHEGLCIFAQVSPMIMSFEGTDSLGFQVVDKWTLDLKELGKDRPTGCKWPLTKKLVRRSPSNGRTISSSLPS